MPKYDFCSEPYLDNARRLLRELVDRHGAELGDETFSSCVVCLDAPGQLNPERDGSVAWSMAVGRDFAQVTRGRSDDVDSMVIGDYATALPRARRFISDDPSETLPEEEGVRRTGDLARLSTPMRALLRAFHNRLAEITA